VSAAPLVQAEEEIIALKSKLLELKNEISASRLEMQKMQQKLLRMQGLEGEQVLRAEEEVLSLKAALMDAKQVLPDTQAKTLNPGGASRC
jgi:hypothetical protein